MVNCKRCYDKIYGKNIRKATSTAYSVGDTIKRTQQKQEAIDKVAAHANNFRLNLADTKNREYVIKKFSADKEITEKNRKD